MSCIPENAWNSGRFSDCGAVRPPEGNVVRLGGVQPGVNVSGLVEIHLRRSVLLTAKNPAALQTMQVPRDEGRGDLPGPEGDVDDRDAARGDDLDARRAASAGVVRRIHSRH